MFSLLSLSTTVKKSFTKYSVPVVIAKAPAVFHVKIFSKACKNRAYLHKLHKLRKWYFSWSLFMINTLGKPYVLSY